MYTRRSFLMGGLATALCAPSIVRAENLMVLRGIVQPIELFHFGFVERLYVHTNCARSA